MRDLTELNSAGVISQMSQSWQALVCRTLSRSNYTAIYSETEEEKIISIVNDLHLRLRQDERLLNMSLSTRGSSYSTQLKIIQGDKTNSSQMTHLILNGTLMHFLARAIPLAPHVQQFPKG